MNNLILCITTYNRILYLQRCLTTWEKTSDKKANWTIYIADDGSTDGTLELCESLAKNYPIKLIKNNRAGFHRQTNSLFKAIDGSNFDLAFRIDDDVFFKNSGWENLYLEAIEESGYQHLVFMTDRLGTKWRTKPIIKGKLKCITDTWHVFGCFYTLTQEILDKVGYFDLDGFGLHESAHVDFTRRCAQAGFNDPDTPFDANQSNNYIDLSWIVTEKDYIPSLPENQRSGRRTKYDPIIHPQEFLQYSDSRIYIPYNC